MLIIIHRLKLKNLSVFSIAIIVIYLLLETALAQEISPYTAVAPTVSTTSPANISSTPEQIKKAKDILQKRSEPETEKPAVKPLGTETIQSAPVITEKRISPFEAYIRGKSPAAISTEVEQFGYDLFERPLSTFAPVDAVPVAPDYLLGPGDEIKISLWGKFNVEYSAMIDNDGKIILPQIGILHLSGLTFTEAKDFIEREFSRYYLPQEVKMNVSTGRLRTIKIFVVGKARRPGSYTLSSFSTLINALFAAGGSGKNGTMRDIQVRRNGTTITHFDLYDFLMKGDKTKDIRLLPEDVIFIPPVGPLAGVSGNVNTPAIYELKGEKTVMELIELAGGLNDIAFKGRLQIERIIDNRYGAVLDVNIEDIKRSDVKIQPGDLITIFPVVHGKGVVKLVGAVQREGEYGVGTGITVNELISMAGGLMYYAYTDEAEITRITVTQQGPETRKMQINLKKALDDDPHHNIRLQENDYIFVKSVPEWAIYRAVNIKGEVRFPGAYTIEKGETLASLMKRAGGFTDKAYLKGAIFTRESVRELQQRQLNEAIDRLEQQMLSQSARTIETALTPEQTEQDKAAAEQKKALISKLRTAKAKGRLSIRLVAIERFAGSPSDILLEDGDTLIIPEKPQQIQVIGAVYNQTAFVYDPDSTVSSYIEKAGGVTRDADNRAIYILKVDGTAISKRAAGGFLSDWKVLDPGDTIVVPEKIEKIAWLREIKDITQILYQIAVTAGVLIVTF
ncbi:MAG: SLBB domain-containing protein [Nitrospirae bacterium]|nr:SLBB domain-containing protein [Nitrospirota bacterium]